MELGNGALIHFPTTAEWRTDLTVTLTKPQLLALFAAGNTSGITFDGDTTVLRRLLALLDEPIRTSPSSPLARMDLSRARACRHATYIAAAYVAGATR
jgi:ubiquinone biosynthesis protein UbiJ